MLYAYFQLLVAAVYNNNEFCAKVWKIRFIIATGGVRVVSVSCQYLLQLVSGL